MTSRPYRTIKFARRLLYGCVGLICVIQVLYHSVLAEDALSPRLQIGLSLFPSIVAADKNLAEKLDVSRRLVLYLVYQSNNLLAQKLKHSLSKLSSIQNYPLTVVSISQSDLLEQTGPLKGALFVVERARGNLQSLLQFAQSKRVLIFSPYEGDVERGVAAGYQVTNKVLPLVNMRSLRQTEIQLKAFFLRIAVKYE